MPINPAIEARTPPNPWVSAVLRIARHYRIPVSREHIRLVAEWSGTAEDHRELARAAGLALEEIAAKPLSAHRLPVVAEFDDGTIGVMEAETSDGYRVSFGEDNGLEAPIPYHTFKETAVRCFALRPIASVQDRRIDTCIQPFRQSWLRKIVLADLRPYRAVLVASFVTNLLALAGILFSMQVYDRVIPSQSANTLYVLFSGVLLAITFGYLVKVARARILDHAGRVADLRMSDRVFGHALRVKNSARPRATATFIAQIRELEHVREV